jgi:protocatechuate 3,4-dioxygenase beta subunit
MNLTNESRRDFLKRATVATVAFPLLINCKSDASAQKSSEDILSLIKKNASQAEGAGEWNGAKDAPKDVSWRTILSKDSDKGEKILISGTVYQADGKTPAPNVLIYLYHTDIEGFYGRRGDAHRHGRYRGWMLTDEKGRYEFQTIKPAPYPERRFAAHIHFTLTTATMREDWIDSILFEGDALISQQERNQAGKKGGFNPIVTLEKSTSGIWTARRDIQLWKV